MNRNFYINELFFVEPHANLVTYKLTGAQTRLEAMIMQILNILVQRKGETVTRDELVTTIWQDYGGGDEGLTQAISILRKTLLDSKKNLYKLYQKKDTF